MRIKRILLLCGLAAFLGCESTTAPLDSGAKAVDLKPVVNSAEPDHEAITDEKTGQTQTNSTPGTAQAANAESLRPW